MAKEICKLNLTLVDNGKSVAANADLDFDRTMEDMAVVFAHLFHTFGLEDSEVLDLIATAIIKRMESKERRSHETD